MAGPLYRYYEDTKPGDILGDDFVRDVLSQLGRPSSLHMARKFGRKAPHVVTTLADVDVLISNAPPRRRTDSAGREGSLPGALFGRVRFQTR